MWATGRCTSHRMMLVRARYVRVLAHHGSDRAVARTRSVTHASNGSAGRASVEPGHERTGCPLGAPEFAVGLEGIVGRTLSPKRAGRKAKGTSE